MPSADEIQQYLTGAWRLMNGRQDGLEMLDISSDGFWNSFYAILLCVPVFTVGWVSHANEVASAEGGLAGRGAIVLGLAFTDLAAWIVPIAGLALVARSMGIGDRFVHYVVASNWGSVITVWLMLPPSLIDLAGIEGGEDIASVLLFGLFILALFLSWRLTNAVLQKGAAIATAVFGGMMVFAIMVLLFFQAMLGLLPSAVG